MRAELTDCFLINKQALMDMYQVLNSTSLKTPEELKAEFPSPDNFKYRDRCYVLNVSVGTAAE